MSGFSGFRLLASSGGTTVSMRDPLTTPDVAVAPSDKERAIKIARTVLQSRNLGIALTPSESIILAGQYLRELGLPESP